MGQRKNERLRKVILRKASDVILHELHDPRLGFVTLSKVDLSDDTRHATIYYSVMGDDAIRSRTRHALDAARGYVQRAVAGALQTRIAPHVRFKYDESIEGAMRVTKLIDDVMAADAGAGPDPDDADEPTPQTPDEE